MNLKKVRKIVLRLKIRNVVKYNDTIKIFTLIDETTKQFFKRKHGTKNIKLS